MQIKNLTDGPITSQIVRLTLPILGTSFVQMAYNLTDMLWLGRVGSDAVAAVGIASYISWLGVSLMLIGRIAAEVGVSQSLGAKDKVKAESYAVNAITIVLLMSGIYGAITYFFAPELISFFHIQNSKVEASAISYSRIIAVGSLLYYSNPTFTGIINGTGNSKLPFRINAVGLLSNVVLNPVLIFGLGPFPKLGSDGSAIATVISQSIVMLIFIVTIGSGEKFFRKNQIAPSTSTRLCQKHLQIGCPSCFAQHFICIFWGSPGSHYCSLGGNANRCTKYRSTDRGAKLDDIRRIFNGIGCFCRSEFRSRAMG